MQMSPIPAPRNANASSTVLTITMLDAPFASATAAVVKARNTSMTATVPVARLAPSKRLWIEISIPSSDGIWEPSIESLWATISLQSLRDPPLRFATLPIRHIDQPGDPADKRVLVACQDAIRVGHIPQHFDDTDT